MNKIKEVLDIRKTRTEKNIGMYIAVLIAAVGYGFWKEFTMWPTFFSIFAVVSVLVGIFEYKFIREVQVFYKKVEEKWKNGLIDEEQAIAEIKAGNLKKNN